MSHICLITPPFCQLNTPYAAMPFLSGTLLKYGHTTQQIDVGIAVFRRLFSQKGLERFFDRLRSDFEFDRALEGHYLTTIDPVISFLSEEGVVTAGEIIVPGFLPEGPRFSTLSQNSDIVGGMDVHEKGLYYASLYIDDLSDLMNQTVIPGFGLSKYQESLGQSARSFDEMYAVLQERGSDLVAELTSEVLNERLTNVPALIAITVPFPGNLYGALVTALWAKERYPEVPIVLGGGFVNSELRSLSDSRIFEAINYLCFDDGERPLLQIIESLNEGATPQLLRTMVCESGEVVLKSTEGVSDLHVNSVGTPDYAAVDFTQYISLYESANPMHTLWSRRGWLKLRVAHGCYWKKCSFCDVSLDYIGRYQVASIEYLIEVIEELIARTGLRTFHFVDEALPPKTVKMFSRAIIERGIDIEWWGNIRFESAYTLDLALLMRRAGCVAVTGGLEAVTDSVLDRMNKGVSTQSAILTCANFAQAGILTHTYLIYSFPGQTIQEGVDALEILRQMYAAGVLHSSFWHRFSLTVHSPVAQNPEKYGVQFDATPAPFANNDLEYTGGGSIDQLGPGLKKANYNFMHGVGFDALVNSWFEEETPEPTIAEEYVYSLLSEAFTVPSLTKRVLWYGGACSYSKLNKNHSALYVKGLDEQLSFEVPHETARWIKIICKHAVPSGDEFLWRDALAEYPESSPVSIEDLIQSELWYSIKLNGLFIV